MKLMLFSFLLAYAILAASPVAADFYIYRMWQIFYMNHYETYSEKCVSNQKPLKAFPATLFVVFG